jgi:hypothetical protein
MVGLDVSGREDGRLFFHGKPISQNFDQIRINPSCCLFPVLGGHCVRTNKALLQCLPKGNRVDWAL